jgi:hypothetical protein
MSTELTTIAEKKYQKLKAIVRRWMDDRFAVGAALKEIRDEELYKSEYENFEDFCHTEYGFKRARAYQLIEASEVKLGLAPVSAERLTNEGQARALSAVPEPEREEVLNRAAETGRVTAKSITEAAQPVQRQSKPEKIINLDKTGYAIPDSIYADWQQAESFREELSKLREVKRTVKQNIEDRSLPFREITNTVINDIENLINELNCVLPYAVCPTCSGHSRNDCTRCRGRGFVSKFSYDMHTPSELKALREKGVKRA